MGPRDIDEAREFVSSYSAAPCGTVGALCVHDLVSGLRIAGVHETSMSFAPFPNDVVEQLVSDDDCRRCAGSLMVEHPLIAPYVREIIGGIDSVMGLSTALLTRLLTHVQSMAAARPAMPAL